MSKFIEVMKAVAVARAEADSKWLSTRWAGIEQKLKRQAAIWESVTGQRGKRGVWAHG